MLLLLLLMMMMMMTMTMTMTMMMTLTMMMMMMMMKCISLSVCLVEMWWEQPVQATHYPRMSTVSDATNHQISVTSRIHRQDNWPCVLAIHTRVFTNMITSATDFLGAACRGVEVFPEIPPFPLISSNVISKLFIRSVLTRRWGKVGKFRNLFALFFLLHSAFRDKNVIPVSRAQCSESFSMGRLLEWPHFTL